MKQEYKEFLDWCKENDLLTKYGFLKKNHSLRKETKEKLNVMFPFEADLSYKLKLIQKNIALEEVRCPVGGCSNLRKFSRNKILHHTCGKKDQNHKDYIFKIKAEKTSENNLKKYGVTCTLQVEEFKEKRKKTFLKKYGVTVPLKNKNILQKAINTNLEKYGVEYAIQAPETRKKITKTFIKKYGVKNPSNVSDIIEKKKILSFEKYGVFHKSQLHYNQENFLKLSKEFIEKNFLDANNHFKLSEFMNFLNCNQPTAHRILHKYNIKWDYGPGGFDPNKPGTLYYIKDKESNLYKIGITNKTLEERFGKDFISKQVEILLEETYENGEQAYLAEQEILTAFGSYRITNKSWPEEKGGKTEFFKEDILRMDKKGNL